MWRRLRRLDLFDNFFRHHRVLHHHAMCFHNGSLLAHILFLQPLDALAQNFSDGTDGLLCFFLFRL